MCVRSKFVRPLCAMPFNSSPIFSSWISFFITNDVSHGPNYLCVFFVQDIIFDRQNDESITHSIMTPLWVMTGVVNLFFCQKFASQLGHLDLIRCISLWLYKSNKLNLIAFSVNCILLSLFITVTCTLKQSKVCNAFLLCSRPQVSNCDLLCRALWEGTFVLFPIWIKYLVGFSWTDFFFTLFVLLHCWMAATFTTYFQLIIRQSRHKPLQHSEKVWKVEDCWNRGTCFPSNWEYPKLNVQSSGCDKSFNPTYYFNDSDTYSQIIN